MHTYMYNNCLLENKKILTFRNHWISALQLHIVCICRLLRNFFFSALTNKRLERV